ncbi:hypothetical protein JTB14_012929 [Gonioctena quinquepunctata]|nr:hypothetical protein JTB14_012929 [Gonioctena quinquepunctata]
MDRECSIMRIKIENDSDLAEKTTESELVKKDQNDEERVSLDHSSGPNENNGFEQVIIKEEVLTDGFEGLLTNSIACETEHVDSADYILYEDIKTEIVKEELSDNEPRICEMCYENFNNGTDYFQHKIDGLCCEENYQNKYKLGSMDTEHSTDFGTSTSDLKNESNSSFADSRELKHHKYCLVPQCKASTSKYPDMKFISLPTATSSKLRRKRKAWLLAMGRDYYDISVKTRGFVCEDHFNLEEDMVNYTKYKLMGGNIFLKDHVVPHIFDRQEDRKRSLEEDSSGSSVASKKERKQLVETLLSENCDLNPSASSKVIGDEVKIEISEMKLEPLTVLKCDKYTQTDKIPQRTVSVQHIPTYESSFAQTDDCNFSD